MESIHPWKPGTEKIWQDAIKGMVGILIEYLRNHKIFQRDTSGNHKGSDKFLGGQPCFCSGVMEHEMEQDSSKKNRNTETHFCSSSFAS